MQRVEIWIFTTLFAVGIIIGMTYMDMRSAPADPAGDAATALAIAEQADSPEKVETLSGHQVSAPSPDENVQTTDSHFSLTAAQLTAAQLTAAQLSTPALSSADINYAGKFLNRGDQFLIAGNYTLALESYIKFEKYGSVEKSNIQLRQAFCYERQSQFGQAEKLYRDAIQTAANPNHQILAIAGFSRTLLEQNRIAEALDLISVQVLKIDGNESIPVETRAELVFQFAKILESNAISAVRSANQSDPHTNRSNEQALDLTLPDSIVFHDFEPNPESFLNQISSPVSPNIQQANQNRAIEILQRPSDSVLVITMSASTGLQPVNELLRRLGDAGDVEFFLSQRARNAIEGRSRIIDLKSTTLASLLDQMLISFDLGWLQTGRKIEIFASDELGSGPNHFWIDLANRAYRRFEIEFSENELRSASLLSRANLSLMRGDFDTAGNLYQELEQTGNTGEVQAKMFFNQGKLNSLLGRQQESRRLLYLAVDQTLDSNVESSAYCLLSGNHLSDGDLENAIRASRRGLTTAVNFQQRRIATLNLARAYLLKNDPFSANLALFRNREFFEDSDLKPIATILGTYARSIGVSDEGGVRTARVRMLTAISMMKDDQLLSFADCYVMAMGYEQLGFHERAATSMQLALSKPDLGTWQRRIGYELARIQYRLQQVDEAVATFEQLAATEDQWKSKSLQQLAQIYFDANEIDRCIATCQRLWESEMSESQRNAALQLLGSAYQSNGEFHAAALCFAGILPNNF